jgi:TnsA endonuclease N terminal
MRKFFEIWANRRLQGLTSGHKKWIATPQYRRARRVIGRSGGLMRGKFPSLKNERMVHWESQLERDAIFLFEYSAAVHSYREQPFTTFYVIDDRTYRYTPDFELTFVDQSKLVVEVKPALKMEQPEIRRKFDRVGEHFEAKGQKFRVLTDLEIRQQQLLENLKLVQRYRCPPLSNLERRNVLAKLAQLPIRTFEKIERMLGSPSEVWALIGHRLLVADLRVQIEPKTSFEINFEDCGDDDMYF